MTVRFIHGAPFNFNSESRLIGAFYTDSSFTVSELIQCLTLQEQIALRNRIDDYIELANIITKTAMQDKRRYEDKKGDE